MRPAQSSMPWLISVSRYHVSVLQSLSKPSPVDVPSGYPLWVLNLSRGLAGCLPLLPRLSHLLALTVDTPVNVEHRPSES